MIKDRKFVGLAGVALVALLAACGGGGGGGGITSLPATGGGGGSVVTTPATTPPAVASGFATASVSISLPKGTFKASAARTTQAIGVGTASIVFTLLQQNGTPTTGTPQPFGLTASSAGCTVNGTTGALGCTLLVDAPIGTDVFLAQTYDGPNGTGNLTGSGAVALSVGINSTNTASIVLNAQVASVLVVSRSFYLGDPSNQNLSSVARSTAGARHPLVLSSPLPAVNTSQLYIVAADSSGNIILNPSSYSSPIYLQLAFYPQSATADVTLSVTYAAGDPSPCTPGATVSASSWYASFPVCSPSDSVSLSLNATGGASPSHEAIVFGWVSPSSLVPPPVGSATPLPVPPPPTTNSFADLLIYFGGQTAILPIVAQ